MLPKILLVTRNFPPLIGGMEKLNFNICRALKSSFSLSLAGPEGSQQFHDLKSFTEFPVKPLWKYVLVSLFKTLILAVRVKPKIVFCGSGAAIVAGFFSAKITGASLVCYLHGLDIIVDSKIYKWFFLPLIRKSDLILVNSNHTAQLAKFAGVNSNIVKILPPGTDLPELRCKNEVAKSFREKYQLDSNPFILIAGRITERKGIKEFIVNVMPKLLLSIPTIQLVIVGDEAVDAMKNKKGIKSDIIEIIEKLNLNENVKLIGSVNNELFSGALFAANCLVFPVLNIPNDVEGFGMVAIEAAAHGLPTIGFSVGGIPDAISNNQSGWLVESGNYDAMLHKILESQMLSPSNNITAENCIEFAKQFSWDSFEQHLNSAFKELQHG